MTQTKIFRLASLSTPIGAMLIATDDQDRLRVLDWEEYRPRMERLLQRYYRSGAAFSHGPAPAAVADPLHAYFAGDIRAIDAIPVASAGTAFQTAIWAALRKIPAGQTWTYGALARHIGKPAAVRAVGLANGANPIGLVVPCHRVIGASGALTGYAGGLERKRWLLRHEGVAIR